MKNLEAYCAQKNIWRKFSNKPQLDCYNLSQGDVTELAHSIDGDMSPENLYCDGEISAAQARRNAKQLRQAFAELQQVAEHNSYMLPDLYELY